ncbi:Ankyrin repeat-containing domain protein, partial [Russula decolorans]
MEARGMRDETPLFLASMEGKLEAGRFLLDHGADINPRVWRNFTPVCAAAFKGHVGFARMLLERGAAMDVRPQLDSGQTPLTAAIKMGKVQTVRLLLEYGEDVNERDGLGKNPSMVPTRSLWSSSLLVDSRMLRCSARYFVPHAQGIYSLCYMGPAHL